MTNKENGNESNRSAPKMLRILKETNIDFLKYRRFALIISTFLVGLGIFATVQIFVTGNANLGIEFTGGTNVTLEFEDPVSIEDARSALISAGYDNPQITETPGANKLNVRVKDESALNVSDVSQAVQTILVNEFSHTSMTAQGSQSIGPAVGNELREKAIYAIVYALIGIILYIAVRFDFKFGVAASIAMFHDVLAVIGIIWVANMISPMEFTLLIMTAILTLAGYSLTDTVVVFDRIRENLKKSKRAPLVTSINNSINQVLSRTVVTSLTTLLVVVSIFILGGDVLHNFAFALIVGILIGTYSSIFVASPLLVVWQGGKGKLIGGEVVKSKRASAEASS